MKMKRLASALTLSLLTLGAANAAKYRVVELPLQSEGVNNFATAINERGEVVSTVQSPFNPPLDTDLIDFESDFLTSNLTDLSSAAAGNINTDDLVIIFSFLTGSLNTTFNNPFFPQSDNYENILLQQFAKVQSYVSTESEAELIPAFDVVNPSLQGLTKSADTLVKGINNRAAVVGTAESPYEYLDYRNEVGDNLVLHVQDFLARGFLQLNSNTTVPVMPIETIAGGISEALDINDSFEVAGYGSVDISEGFEAAFDDCQTADAQQNFPSQICERFAFDNYLRNLEGRGGRLPLDTIFKRRAMIWQFNAAGDLLTARELGTLIENEPGDNTFYSSRANAINANGIAVGQSNAFFRDRQNTIVDMAAIFDGDEVVGFIDDQTYIRSEALDINDNDIVVGSASLQIGTAVRSKFFVHDYRGEVTTFPDDFFNSSSSVARAINNNGLVIGDGEVDTALTGTRRRSAFLYDINRDEFTDVNTLLSCNNPYTIIQGNDINDSGEIAATATIFRESFDIAGEVELDSRGNTVFSNVIVAVKLVPIPGGSIDDCQLEAPALERKGGGLGIIPLVLLGLLVRRRLK